MTDWPETIVSWLAEVYFLATVILAAALLASLAARQPSRRLAIARAAVASLLLLVPLAGGAAVLRGYAADVAVAEGAGADSVAICRCPSEGAAIPAALPPGAMLRSVASVPKLLAGAFAAGAVLAVAWLGMGAVASRRIAAGESAASERLDAILGRVVGAGRRRPRLIVSSRAAQPVAVGLLRPAIVLPAWFVAGEPDDRVEAAIEHEWTHIRNGDLWLLAASRALLPLFFAHPLYALLRRRIRADQEALADAAAAGRQGPIAYAESLVCWSRAGARASRSWSPAPGLWGRPRALADRVALLLDTNFRVEPRCPRGWRLAIGAAFVALIAGLALSSAQGASAVHLFTPPGAGRPHVHAPSPEGTTSPDNRYADPVLWNATCRS